MKIHLGRGRLRPRVGNATKTVPCSCRIKQGDTSGPEVFRRTINATVARIQESWGDESMLVPVEDYLVDCGLTAYADDMESILRVDPDLPMDAIAELTRRRMRIVKDELAKDDLELNEQKTESTVGICGRGSVARAKQLMQEAVPGMGQVKEKITILGRWVGPETIGREIGERIRRAKHRCWQYKSVFHSKHAFRCVKRSLYMCLILPTLTWGLEATPLSR